MATKKKTRKKTSGKATPRRRKAAPEHRILPHVFAEYVEEVQALLDRVEREVARAGGRTRREATRLLREASRRLGRIEERGERNWRRLTERTRAEALRLLDNLRAALQPKPGRKARKRPT